MRSSHVGAGDRAEDRDSQRTALASHGPRNPCSGALAIPEGQRQFGLDVELDQLSRRAALVSARAYGGVSPASALQPRIAGCGESAAEGWSVRQRGARARAAQAHRVARSLTNVGGSSRGGAVKLRLCSRGAPRPVPRDQCDAARQTVDASRTTFVRLLLTPLSNHTGY